MPQNGGYLDDIQLYDEALADFQVNFLFHNPRLTVPEPSRSLALIAGLGAVLLRRLVGA
ncbi:MAG: PEP-CTERM sorting domain-containing protein [Verrucomicrobiales bacterium]